MKGFAACVAVLCLIFAWQIAPSRSAQTTYEFAYLVQKKDHKLQLFTVLPKIGSNRATAFDTSATETLNRVWLASNGRWLVSEYSSFDEQTYVARKFLRLFDFGSQNQIEAFPKNIAPALFNLGGKPQMAAWSANSQFFAVIATLKDKFVVFVYSTQDNSFRSVELDNGMPLRLALSPDGRLLAVMRSLCIDYRTQPCRAILDIIDTRNFLVQNSIDFTDPARPAALYHELCDLSWSPTNEYIAYSSNCASDLFEVAREVFIYDLKVGKAKQVTNISEQPLKQPNPAYSIFYKLVWTDASTLLIGASATLSSFMDQGLNIMSFFGQGITYNVPSAKFTTIYEQPIAEWAVNPVSKRIVAWSSLFNLPGGSLLTMKQSDPQATATSPERLAPVLNDDSTICLSHWSPTGEVLPYIRYSSGRCVGFPQSLTFLNEDLTTLSTHVFNQADFDNADYILPIGWVVSKE